MSTDALRREVATCSRLLVDAGILNYSGHVSVRIPGTDEFLIQRHDDVRATLEPDRLLVVDLDGNVRDNEGERPSEVFIHTEIYRARPDATAVAHFHHDPTTAFSVQQDTPLVPVKNHFARWRHGVPVHPDSSHIATPARGRAMVETLGVRYGLLLQGHGEVLVAEDVPSLFSDVVHFVENAQTLTVAAQLGKVAALPDELLEDFLATFNRAKQVRKIWMYYTATAARRGVIPPEWTLDQDAPWPTST